MASLSSNTLVVDDALTVTEAEKALLEQTGIPSEEVLTAHTATEAMQLFEEHDPEVVFMDVDLPDMGGHELAKDLREADPDARIVAVTCLHLEDSRVQSLLEEGSVDLVEKPLDQQDLQDLGLLPGTSP